MVLLDKFFSWLEKHKKLHIFLAAGLFSLQLIHLYWLTADVVLQKITGTSFFNPQGIWLDLLLVVDYAEIPAIIATSLLYISELRKKFTWINIWFLLSINSQWLHIFWITDEFVIEQFRGIQTETILPVWLAWIAIVIDYLELPVIYDTLLKVHRHVRKR